MLVMRTAEDLANPVGELVGCEQTVGLDHFTLAVNPFGLYRVKPWAPLGQKAAYNPNSFAAILDLAVMFPEPALDLFGDMPACVVPDQKQSLLASCFELLDAPRQKPGRYPTDGPTIHEPQPCLIELLQVEPVAREGLRLGIILGERPLDEAQRLPLLRPATQGGQGQPTAPALVFEAHRPLGVALDYLHQSVAPSFFLSYRGSGEVIQHLARCQRTPRRRTRVARIVSPETRFSTRPSSKATCAAICSVQRLVSLPNSLGERCSISLTASALSSSKAARVLLGRDERGMRALRPRSLKSWMASRTVCCPQPRFSAICGTSSPLEEARSIWDRRKVKASLERSPASRRLRSSIKSLRTKIGGFIPTTVTHNPKPALNVHWAAR